MIFLAQITYIVNVLRKLFILGVTVFWGLFFLATPQKIAAQSCGGSGYVCWWGLYCPQPLVDGECPVAEEYRWSSNEGCGEYPDCNLMPDRIGCQKWTGTCYNVPPPQPNPYCGDGICTEGCDVCVADCGTCSNPVDPPPELPGGWQGCGSCDTCGYSGECVTDPEGNCLWDPSTCRYIPTCTPVCSSPLCGQTDGCGGTCASTDDGAPAVPIFTVPSVASGQMVRSAANGRITLTWTPRAKAERYILEIHPSTNPADTPGQTLTLTTASYTFTPASRYYSARVRALNTSCGNDYSTWSAFVDFQVAVPVGGTIYYDQSGTAGFSGDLCVGPTTPTPAEAGELTVSGFASDGTYSDVTTAISNAFSLRLPYSTTGENNAQLQIENSDRWLCSCPAGCVYPSGINAPAGNVNFYVLDATDPWFQAEGGPVAAYGSLGTVIQSLISPYCQLPACNPSLILNQNGGDTDGYVLSGGGEIDTSFVADRQTDQIDENRHNWFAQLNSTPNHQDYTYFAKQLRLPLNPESDFGAGSSNASKPIGEVANDGAKTYYHDGDLTIGNAWDIAADETVIVMVDGDVNVTAQTSVEEGGYLMIVSTGDIVFDAELGHDDPAIDTAIVEGVFVANGQIRTPSRGEAAGGDKKFVGEGTFVGWGGFSLERDYDDGAGRRRLNNTAPVEYFRYRPDFLKNAPDTIKRPQYSWREINP